MSENLPRPDLTFLSGGGEMGELIAAFDWAQTSLGAIARWPQSLKTTVGTILRSPVAIVTLWSEDGVMIYNDAYSGFAGGRHPALLGSRVREGWPEVAVFNDNVMKSVLSGRTLTYRDQALTLHRNGVPEPVWMNLDYSPILDEAGAPVGVIAIVVETTEKVRAERWLLGERERLRQVFEGAPGFFALLKGPEHVFEAVNPAYAQLIGGRDVVGKPVRTALSDIEGQGFFELLDQAFSNGEPYAANATPIRLQRRQDDSAEQRFIDFVYQPIRNHLDQVTGVLVQGMDVTDRVLAAAALHESEARFRLVAESAPVMLWMGDQEGKCIYLNRAQREFWGVALEDIETFDWNSTVLAEDIDVLAVPFSRGMATKTGFEAEARYRRADGQDRILRTTAQPRQGAEGEFLGMIGVNVDVTEVRRADTAIRAEKRSLEVLNRTGAVIAAELELENVVQTVTDAGTELTGAQFGAFFYNVRNEEGESYMLYSLSGVPREAFSSYSMPRATLVFRPTFRGEGVVRSNDILQDVRYGHSAPHYGLPPGHPPVRSYLAVPVTSRTGEVLGGLFFAHEDPDRFTAEHEILLIGIAGQAATAIDNARLFQSVQHENSQRAQIEEKLRDLNETLEARVAEEIAERRQTEAALQQAQKMESIGKLTGGVAHDFNNLLQVISGNLQLLAKDVAGNDRSERRVTNALAGVTRGSKLASQLLAFGRRQPLEPKTLNIGRLVSGMDEMLRRTLGETVEVETIVAGGLWTGFVDQSQLENALLNLAINARDAMELGGKLTIEVGNAYIDDAYAHRYPEAAPGQYVMVAVSDTGTGIDPEIVEKILEPFFTTKPEGKGTGLGLSMVYGFVKQSGGHLRIYSELGQGTTIRLYLPRATSEEDLSAAMETGPIVGGAETILVAEDDEEVRETVVELLSDLGYRVLKAKDATGALTVIESGLSIDLLFTDVVMPGALKSPELARMIRERVPHMAVLFTSGYTENSIVHDGKLDPGIDLLSKPYTREALARKIRQVLSKRQTKSSASIAHQIEMPAVPGSPEAQASYRILLVEDDALVLMNTAEILRDLGHVVCEAAHAEAALVLLEKGPIDVLITDLGLPGLNGADFAASVRDRWQEIGIVFATGHTQLPEAVPIKGAVLLSKPYGNDKLADAIKLAIANAGAA
ncbi:MAG TPA: response regulator [Devosia sp.]|nr:response regulator [Devosia sp.]